MSFFPPSAAPTFLADIPPPILPTSPSGLVYFLIFCALCAAAFIGLRKLFRRRSKDPIPRPEDVTKG
jgi:hypothetical protein